MHFLHSRLAFDFNVVENFIEPEVPPVIYRYFDTSEARDSFLQGNIWFCGPNQNRFFSPGGNDPFEYRNKFASFINEYSLSCSEENLKENLPTIKIVNPGLFVQEIIAAITSEKNAEYHQVSWLCKECLSREDFHNHIVNKRPLISSSVNMIEKFPKHNNEKVLLHITGVGARKMVYDEKIDAQSANVTGIESVKNARNGNIDFCHEKEIRIHINTGDFLGEYNGNCLIDLVQYLKIFCPGVSKYCNAA